MRLEQLYGFLTIAEFGSIRKAAKILYTTPQNLSKQLLSLEAELGVTLFDRSRSGISLSIEGKKAFPYIKQSIQELENLKKEFHVITSVESKLRQHPVYITTSAVFEPFANGAVNKLIADFLETPISLEKKSSKELIDLVTKAPHAISDAPDIAIIAVSKDRVSSFLSLLSHDYNCYCLMEDQLHLQVPKSDPLAKLDKISLALIEKLPLLLYNGNPREKTVSEKILESHGCFPKNVSRTSNLETCSQQAVNQKKYCFIGYPSVEFRPLPNVEYIPLEIDISAKHLLLRKKTAVNTPFCEAFENGFFDWFGCDPVGSEY